MFLILWTSQMQAWKGPKIKIKSKRPKKESRCKNALFRGQLTEETWFTPYFDQTHFSNCVSYILAKSSKYLDFTAMLTTWILTYWLTKRDIYCEVTTSPRPPPSFPISVIVWDMCVHIGREWWVSHDTVKLQDILGILLCNKSLQYHLKVCITVR